MDGHGDVRCESVCVTDDAICIYDCIEFNDRFRCGDVASEAAFLAMDLDARGRPDLGYFFTEAYQRRTGDEDFFTLLPFYRCYRAYVRGKVLSFRLNEAEFSEEERREAAARAGNFFDLARALRVAFEEAYGHRRRRAFRNRQDLCCARHRRRTRVAGGLCRRGTPIALRRSQTTGSLWRRRLHR